MGGRLGVFRPIYVDVDSPNLGFPYFNFLEGYQLKKNTLYKWDGMDGSPHGVRYRTPYGAKNVPAFAQK